jgi:cell division septation protein DedD
MLEHVVFDSGTPAANVTQAAAPQTSAAAAAPVEEGWRVQVGAYRIAENVAETKRQLERLGHRPDVRWSGGLQIVSVGPFASLDQAQREAARLKNANIKSIVTSEDAPQPSPIAGPGTYVVQLGAFRERTNAQQLIRRLARLARRAQTVVSGSLTFVSVGPFTSRKAAAAESDRLRNAGFETLVTNR